MRRQAPEQQPGLARRRPGVLLVLAMAVAAGGCSERDRLPAPGSDEHGRAVTAFHVGLAAFQAGDDERANARFSELTTLAPGEPAGWADWGALAMRQGQLDAASQRIERALALAPKSAQVHLLLGLLRSRQGRSADAVEALRRGLELDPGNAHMASALAQEIERQGGPEADARALEIMRAVRARQPANVAAALEVGRLAAKQGDKAGVVEVVDALSAAASDWPPDVGEQFSALREAARQGDLRAAALRIVRLRNLLQQWPAYQQDLAEIRVPSVAQTPPLARLAALEAPPSRPAPADTGLRFAVEAAGPGGAGWSWAGGLRLDQDSAPVLAAADATRLVVDGGATLSFPGKSAAEVGRHGVLQTDFSYDFKTDLVLAGAGGVRLYRQGQDRSFADVTDATRLPASVLAAPWVGAWAGDIEADGDVDIVLGASRGEPVVLQNNGDGTFTPIRPFTGVDGLRDFIWADLDGDGTPDAAMVDGERRLQVRLNRRQGRFEPKEPPAELRHVRAIAASDVDARGGWSLIVAQDEGALAVLALAVDGAWHQRAFAPAPSQPRDTTPALVVADFDNNAAQDVALLSSPPSMTGATAKAPPDARPSASGALVWLGGTGAAPAPLETAGPAIVTDAIDLDGDGRLDLVGLSPQGEVRRAINRGSRNYHWQVVRPRAAQAFGDQRISPFAIGGEVEIRAGAVVQKRLIEGPVVHFGLGEHTSTDVVRLLWPNGVVQAEFDAKADQAVNAEQRLKGSCPFLFAWDGQQVRFVKDGVPWGSAIGLRINTIGTARVEATQEWYRIGRDQLAARDGEYDLRITAELWEVYYYDQLGLTTVDHPAGTEVFVDERFVIPPVPPAVVVVDAPRPIARAVDDLGHDVTQVLSAKDGDQLDSFGRGQYQGVTRDHYVEVDLGADTPASGSLMLIAHGSLRPTDSSINVALSQGSRWRPQGMRLEVPDGRGGWRVARKDLGFPAGRMKTVLFDLSGLFGPNTPRRVRIATNLEIYWDHIEWALRRDDVAVRATALRPSVADLRYRGYSTLSVADAGAPEVPHYDRLSGTAPRWRDLAGYYTRYGDVRELVGEVDDRYVIMNAGDEMALRFPAPADPPPGWVRDFVVTGDGWIKDGDFNSMHSRTVQPLPHHGERDYTGEPVPLGDEWVVRRHPRDWETYHTRYVTGTPVRDAMRSER